MNCIRLVSLMAPNADVFYRALAGWLARRTGVCVEIEEASPWSERERMFDAGAAHVAVLCGLSYVRKLDGAGPELELLGAPVMRARRYAGRPIYFSDVVVHSASPAQSFADLRGESWAYNETGSHSGFNLPRFHLARLGESLDYFDRVIEAGSHERSLRLVANGQVAASAIDSIVLDREFTLHPNLRRSVRVIETLGPSAAPPAVVHHCVPRQLRQLLKTLIRLMHRDIEGASILHEFGADRFDAVRDEDYDPIREADRVASAIWWNPDLVEHPAERASTVSSCGFCLPSTAN